MNLLICSATEAELIVSKQIVNEIIPTEFLVTGIGLTATTYSLSRRIYKQKPDFIIQAGIAGGFDTGIKINEVVAIHKDYIGDLGVEESGKFRSVFDLGLIAENQPPWQNKALINQNAIVNNCGLKVVNSATVNEISTNNNRINYYRDQLNVQVESMEGAALHYVCISENIPFIQIRSISNFAGERDKKNWDLKNSIAHLNEELMRIIKTLKQ
jgi:futalosine hydrolase